MRYLVILPLAFIAGCASTGTRVSEPRDAKTLVIRWQRFLDEEGQTCERCGSTEQELAKAVASLRKSLGPIGIRVVLEKKPLTAQEFAKDTSVSNRIWIGDRLLEDWLGAEVGESLCGSCCAAVGERVDCRTLTVGGRTYEAIPAELIIKAGLLAASQLVDAPASAPCCQGPQPPAKVHSGCCP